MSITAILTVYRRPHVLIEQLIAIQNQTIKPDKIIIFKNFYEGVELPIIPDELNKNVTIITSSENFGVWSRFAIGLLANTVYVCIFDDDTIPKSKWFENCLNTMNTSPGLFGTNGVIFNKGDKYLFNNIGWIYNNNDTTTEVDIVGHSWFFKREWLHYLWEYTPDYSELLRGGEDIAFSAMLQKHGIKTYVPPHPKSNMDLWGSTWDTGNKYGMNLAATSVIDGHATFEKVLQDFINNKGYVTINNKKQNGAKKKSKTIKKRIK